MTATATSTWLTVARWRVPLGFATFIAAFMLATPTTTTVAAGAAIAALGQALRVWAAGHIEKGREVTTSGPYKHLRHPLYTGSLMMGAGFVIAAASLWTAALAAAYFTITYVAAVRSEEATLDARFDGQYTAYREGRAPEMQRHFSFDRAFGMNKEWRSLAGLASAFALMWWRM